MSRALYFTPDADALKPLVTVASEARKLLRVCSFTFHLPALTDAMIAKHQAGVDVAGIFDSGQAATFPAMGVELAKLKAAGVPYLLGTSPKHSYMHAKYVLADSAVAFGSLNLTVGGQRESNALNVEVNLKIAAQFRAHFSGLWAWIQANEPQAARVGAGLTLDGIDVSDNNGAIDWQAVKGAGVHFAYIKLTEGVTYVNAYAAQWAEEATAAGILVGFYHYALPAYNDPDSEGAWFDQHLAPLAAPGRQIALDLERYQYSRTLPADCGPWADRWMAGRLARWQCRPVNYTSPDLIQNAGINTPTLAQSGLWLASWQATEPATPAPWPFTAIWQRTATGRVAGISGAVDLDVFNGDAAAWRAYGLPGAAPRSLTNDDRVQCERYLLADPPDLAGLDAYLEPFRSA